MMGLCVLVCACVAAEFEHKGHRVRFLIILLWLSATYVIGDLYSSSLTSQLARPAREAPMCELPLFVISIT